MSIGEGFHVEPEILSRAGNTAAEIGDRIARGIDDLPAQARNASGGLDGFALTAALNGCAQAWHDKLESVAHETRGAGERLLSTADTYEKADVAGRGGFDALGRPPG
jgi:hypothetical protein